MFFSNFLMVRGGPAKRHVRRSKIFALAKGFRGRRKNCYRIAVRAVHKKLQYQYVGRRLKKRDMRRLWVTRINIASREHNVPYASFMHTLTKEDILINRKMLAEFAIHEPRTFQSLAELAKNRMRDGILAAIK